VSIEPHWFIYREDGPPIGPLPTELIAEAILAGTYPPDVYVAAPGAMKWLRAQDVPNIAKLLQGIPTRRRTEDPAAASGLQPVQRKFDETERADGLHAPTFPLEPPYIVPGTLDPLPVTQREPAPPSSTPPPPEGNRLASEDFDRSGWRKAR